MKGVQPVLRNLSSKIQVFLYTLMLNVLKANKKYVLTSCQSLGNPQKSFALDLF
jgi:hypothetical protein